jgi:hypothetical protein
LCKHRSGQTTADAPYDRSPKVRLGGFAFDRFAFEERTRGPPESASVSYFVYRVPEGSYIAELGANVQTFVAHGGQAVYIGDFALVRDTRGVELRSDLPAAQNAVAPLLPSNLTLVNAQ